MADSPDNITTAEEIRNLRKELNLTQKELAKVLGVVYATVNRWENGQTAPSAAAVQQIRDLAAVRRADAQKEGIGPTPGEEWASGGARPPDFQGDPERLSVLAEGERLAVIYGANPAFATEVSRIDPLPHQRLAVYRHMLPQPRLRFLLADDPGAGKTIMAGLFIREALGRRTLGRVLIVPPAGLVGNWQRELESLFDLRFQIIRGGMARSGNPFLGEDAHLAIISIDTLSGDRMWSHLRDPAVEPYDLVIFDEAHKLSASEEQDGSIRYTQRYRVGAALCGLRDQPEDWALDWSATHVLLLTATPHQGKAFPYYALWKLLNPELFCTEKAFEQFPAEARSRYFLRRVKEEMVDYKGRPLYPERLCATHSYDLTQGEISEQALYDRTTDYIGDFYNLARMLSRTAARFAMTVFQRRLASSTWALLCSLRNRLQKIDGLISAIRAGRFDEAELIARQQKSVAGLRDLLAETTADEEDSAAGEAHEQDEDKALGFLVATNLEELQREREIVQDLVTLAEAVYAKGEESKFAKMYELLSAPDFAGEKVIIYTEHRDTLDFLVRKLEALGHTGQVAHIHGGLGYEERDAQVERFRRPHGEGKPGARFFIGTDAAAEGINLQFCSILVNYDVPWNPSRLEQRMGRIHRYGQPKPKVLILNLVAGQTREGKVVGTLLRKLEDIRMELGNDKVFDVIGRMFEGVSLLDYVQSALEGAASADQAAADVAGRLTAEQVAALAARERSIYGDGGEVARELPALRDDLAKATFRRVLPGYIRRFVEKAAPVLGLQIVGDLGNSFEFQESRPRILPEFQELMIRSPESRRLSVRPPEGKEPLIFMHPGEPIFDRFSLLARQRCRIDGLRGAVFTDARTAEPYLLHLARISIDRLADTEIPKLRRPRQLEQRVVALKQTLGNQITTVPPETLLLLKPGSKILKSAVGFISQQPLFRNAALTQLRERFAPEIVAAHRAQWLATAPESEQQIRLAYSSMEVELLTSRAKLTEQSKLGDPRAQSQLERVKAELKGLYERRDQALAVLCREPELIAAHEIEWFATLLVQPTTDPEDLRRQDSHVESIAMEVAMTYERLQGALVTDVSDAEKARAAGLEEYPGFDLLAQYETRQHAIEVKGRAESGDIELTENEWAKAANLRSRYWLYVVFDCATVRPELHRIQDPFGKLVAKAKGKLTIAAADIVRLGNQN